MHLELLSYIGYKALEPDVSKSHFNNFFNALLLVKKMKNSCISNI